MSTSVLAPQPLFEKRELHSPSLWLCLGHRMTPQMRTLRSASPLAPTAPWPAPPCTRCGRRGRSGLFSRRRTYLLTLPPSAPLTQFPRCPRTTLGAAGETPAPTWPSAPATTLHLHVVNCLAHPTLASEFIHSLSSLFTLLSLKSQFCPSMRNGVSTIHPFEPQPPLLLLRTLL